MAAGRLAGRVAIVTGAGQGLGKAISAALADEGATVALLGRTPQKVVDVSKELIDKGHTALAIGCDVSDRDAVNSAVAETLAAFGRIDIVINNAQGGALGIDRPTVDLSDDDVLEFFRTGPLGTLHLMQAAFRRCANQITRLSSILVPPLGFGVAHARPPTRWRRRRSAG